MKYRVCDSEEAIPIKSGPLELEFEMKDMDGPEVYELTDLFSQGNGTCIITGYAIKTTAADPSFAPDLDKQAALNFMLVDNQL